MALVNCPECGKEISDRATACIGCGYPLTQCEHVLTAESSASNQEINDTSLNSADSPVIVSEHTQGGAESKITRTPPTNISTRLKKPKNKKKIVLISLGSLVIIAGIIVAAYNIIINSPSYKLRNWDLNTATETFFDSFYNTAREERAMQILAERFDEEPRWFGWSHPLLSLGSRIINDTAGERDREYFYQVAYFFQIANEKIACETTEKWSTFLFEVERLADIATPLREIHANPRLFHGEQVVVVGIIHNNDIRRGSLRIDIVNPRGSSFPPRTYPLEIFYKLPDGNNVLYVDEKWYDAQLGETIIAFGFIEQIGQHAFGDAILVALAIDYIDEVDLSLYTIPFDLFAYIDSLDR